MNSSPILTFVDLLYPFLLFVVVFALQFFIKKADNDVTKFQFSVFGIVTFESAMRKLLLVRMFLLLIALGLLSISSIRDYSRFFPSHMQMEVFFDDEGIQKALGQFSEEELASLNLAENWQLEKVKYVNALNKVLEEIKHPFRFDSRKGAVRSKGENYVEVVKVETWGWQSYHIEDGRGSVTHTFETPGQEPRTITSTFELLETESNYLRLSMSDIYWNWKKVITPEYKQKFSRSQSDTFYSHNLISLTKVRFFPYVDIGHSVYLTRLPSSQKYTPVGYAIYYPD